MIQSNWFAFVNKQPSKLFIILFVLSLFFFYFFFFFFSATADERKKIALREESDKVKVLTGELIQVKPKNKTQT